MGSLTYGIAGGVLAAALALGSAQAQDAQDEGGERSARESRLMRLLDTDGDGRISIEEIIAEQERLLRAADVDGDGVLSVEEFRRRGRWFQQLSTTTLFDLMDADGDQMLTQEEIAAPSRRWLSRYDQDGDQALDADELPRRRWR